VVPKDTATRAVHCRQLDKRILFDYLNCFSKGLLIGTNFSELRFLRVGYFTGRPLEWWRRQTRPPAAASVSTNWSPCNGWLLHN